MHLFLAFLVSVALVACDAKQKQPTVTETPRLKEEHTYSPPVKVDVSIIEKDVIRGIKRGLSVRLDKKISEEVLIDVAHKIKQSDPNRYERTLITYYLPNMPSRQGAWASTDFDPELEVRIFGLSIEQETALMSSPRPARKGIHGVWIDELHKRRLTIFSNNKGFFMEELYTDGGSRMLELKQKMENNTPMLREIDGDDNEPPYVVGSDGNLYLSAPDGLWSIGIRRQETVASPAS